MADFEISIKKVLVFEGGYVNNPNDAGGETRFGICKRSYPNEDIRNLTIERAKEMYRHDFWNRIHGDQINDQQTANSFLDQAVLEGVSAAIKREEASVNIPATGVISDLLIQKLNSLV